MSKNKSRLRQKEAFFFKMTSAIGIMLQLQDLQVSQNRIEKVFYFIGRDDQGKQEL